MPERNSKPFNIRRCYEAAREFFKFHVPAEIVSSKGIDSLARLMRDRSQLESRLSKLEDKVERRLAVIKVEIDIEKEGLRVARLNLMVADVEIRTYDRKEEREAAADTKLHERRGGYILKKKEAARLHALAAHLKNARKKLGMVHDDIGRQVSLVLMRARLSQGA